MEIMLESMMVAERIAMLLTGCSSAEPVFSSTYNTKLAFLI